MKTTTKLAIVLYLIIFIFGLWWLYNRYYHKIITSKDNSQSTITPDKSIFYSKGNNLYQLNSEILNASSQDINNIRLQSTGQVSSIVIDKNDNLLFYEATSPQKITEIWQVNLSDSQSEKLISNQTPGFEKYINFKNPKLSFDNQYLGFLATIDGSDHLFSYKIKDKSLTNLLYPTYQGQISDFDWSKDSLSIYYIAVGGEKSFIKSVNLDKSIKPLWEGTATLTKISLSKDKIIVLYLLTDSVNIGYFDTKKLDIINPITDLNSPKTVSRFDLSSTGKQITYQVNDITLKTNDLYIVNTDGTNLLQITNNGKSYYPVFSPDGINIAFWIDAEGIYTMKTDKNAKQKLLNDLGTINNIIIWS